MKRLSVQLNPRFKDFVSDFLLGLDAQGVSEEINDENEVTVKALFYQDTYIEEIVEKLTDFGNSVMAGNFNRTSFRITVDHVDRREWEVWRNYLKTVRVGKRIIIYPPWDDPGIKDDEIAVEINPSMAFGTGHHETTRLCLISIEQICRQNKIERLIDIGCGSSILGIVAAKLGVESVIALDNDILAAKETVNNIKVNDVTDRFISFCGTIDNLYDIKADIVVANITTGPILNMKSIFHMIIKKDGYLVLSGIPKTGKQEILCAINSEGFELEDIKNEGDWLAFIYGNRTTKKAKENGY